MGALKTRKLLESFMTNAPHLVQRVRDAVLEQRLDSVEAIAHELKGVSSNIGARSLALAAGEIVDRCRNHQTQDLSEKIGTLDRLCRETLDGLTVWLQ